MDNTNLTFCHVLFFFITYRCSGAPNTEEVYLYHHPGVDELDRDRVRKRHEKDRI